MPNKTLEGEIRYYTDGEQATADTLNRPVEDVAKTGQYIGEAQFMKNAEVNRSIYAGSGYIDLARTQWGGSVYSAFQGLADSDVKAGMSTRNLGEGGYSDEPFKNSIIMDWNHQYHNYDHRSHLNINGNKITFIAPETPDGIGSTGKIKLPDAPKSLTNINTSTISGNINIGEYLKFSGTNIEEKVGDISASNWHDISSHGTLEDYGTGLKLTQKSGIDCWAFYNISGLIKGAKYTLKVNVTERTHSGRITIRVNELPSYQYTWGAKGEISINFTAVANTDTIRVQMHDTPAVDSYILFQDLSIKLAEQQLYLVNKDIITNTDVIALEASTLLQVDSISRQDLVFLETWHELIQEKDIVYPLGNIQYKGGNTDGLSGIAEGSFSGAETYSLFGNWQSANDLVGLGYVWSSLSQEDKLKFASNKDNNIYMSKDGLVQVRYRVRVVQGLGNEWSATGWDDAKNTLAYNDNLSRVRAKGKKTYNTDYIGNHPETWNSHGHLGIWSLWSDSSTPILTYGDRINSSALPIALVQRRNQGAFDPVHNPEGSSVFSDGKMWYETSASHNNLIDCFNNAGDGDIASGTSGRPDGLYYDEINERDVEDLRMSAHKITDKKGYLEEQFNKAVAGEIRGKEYQYSYRELAWGSNNRPIWLASNNLNIGSGIQFYTEGHPNIDTNVYERVYEVGRILPIVFSNGGYMLINITSKQGANQSYRGTIKEIYGFTMDDLTYVDGAYYYPTILKVFVPTRTGMSVQNNTALVCDIIGDPRTLAERVRYTTTGSTQSVAVASNDYVLDGTTYYRFIGTPGTLDLNGEDFTVTTNWKDLGTDGSVGGYPQEWKDHGVLGTPLLVGENGESLLPADVPIESIGSAHHKKFKLSRKNKSGYGIKANYSIDKGVTWKSLSPSYNNDVVGQDNGFYIRSESNNLHISGNISDYDNIIIQVFYETSADNTELTNNMPVEAIGSQGMFSQYYYMTHGSSIGNVLINKVAVGTNTSSYPNSTVFERFNIDTSLDMANGQIFSKTGWGWSKPISGSPIEQANGGGGAKFFPYLTKSNSRAQMNLVFKELKWDTGSDNPADVINTPAGTAFTCVKGDLLKLSGYDNPVVNGLIIQAGSATTGTTWSVTSWDGYFIDVNNILRTSNGPESWKIWDGNGWGDDSQFQIIDNVSTMQDDNDQTVLYGQKAIKLPNFLD